jgi:hypothetical protein
MKSEFYNELYTAIDAAMEDCSELDPKSSDKSFWVLAIAMTGIPEPATVQSLFGGKSNELCVDAFVDCTSNYLCLKTITLDHCPPPERHTREAPSSALHQGLFATKFLEIHYATNMVDLVD